MQQLMEFAGNHLALVGAFAVVLVLIAVSEFSRRNQGFKVISSNEAVDFMNRENPHIIDVSPAADFDKGHIVDAKNISLSRLKDPDPEVAKLVAQPILVTCKTGQTAQQAASMLARMGSPEVAVIKGGMGQWVSDNFPITRA